MSARCPILSLLAGLANKIGMAIIIQQEKKKFSWFGVATTMVLIVLIVVAAYYFFFAPVPGIEIVAPSALQNTVNLSKITFDPSSVVNSRQFKSLRVYASPTGVGNVGKANPFQ